MANRSNLTIKLLPILLLSAALAGCAASGSSSGSSAAAGNTSSPGTAALFSTGSQADLGKVTLRVGQTGWASLEQGFKAAGVDDTPYKLEFSVFQGGNLQLEAIAADHLDVAQTSEIPPIFASQSAGGGNFKIIALSNSNTLNQEVVVPKGSPLKQPADLKGKKVAFVKATTAHYFLLKILQEAGLSWSDIQPVELSTADGLSALLSGKVDALASYGNSIITAHENGASTLASAKDILSGNFPIEATPAAIADPGKHAAIADFLNRLNRYQEWARQNKEKWAEITAAATHQDPETALKTLEEGEAQRPSKVLPVTPEAIASNQDVADALQTVGLLKAKVDVSSFFSDAFASEIK
ncbi:ABC transporter substrate-binding protein [Paenibacillus humicus]|uniref:ABC transporter substrate-binding protein n=1 Tax=Paenibacillus humicus TaxID=412861 RepID=UPI003F156F61